MLARGTAREYVRKVREQVFRAEIVEVGDDGRAQSAHRGHGDDVDAAPGIDGIEQFVGIRGREAGAGEQLGHAFALDCGLGGFGRFAGGRFDRAGIRHRIALAEDFHGEVPHGLKANGEAGEIRSGEGHRALLLPSGLRRWLWADRRARRYSSTASRSMVLPVTPPDWRRRSAAGWV